MDRRVVRALSLLAALLAAGWLGLATAGQAQAQVRRSTASDLFYNYYAPPGGCQGVAAAMYPCPRPTPPLVGHTYVTYQPLLPHEFLYQHARVYWRHNPGAGYTRTSVRWR